MSRQSLTIGRVLGIPVALDYSWFLVFVLVSWILGRSYFPTEFPGWSPFWYWAVAVITTLLLFASVLIHEIGHSITARYFRLPVKRIVLFIFGGVAQIVGEPPSAKAEFWIALAGPVTSFILGILFQWLTGFTTSLPQLFAIVKYLAMINIVLAVFNLIPGFPLDGGRVFRAIVWGITKNFRKATFVAAGVGRGFAFLFIFLGALQIIGGRLGDGLWTLFIGWFLDNAAVSQIHLIEIKTALEGHRVAEAMSRNFTTLPADMSLEEIVRHHILGQGRRYALVEEQGKIIGLVTLHHLQQVAMEELASLTVRDIMLPISDSRMVTPDKDLWEALELMDAEGVNQLPVISNGEVVGILTREHLVSFIKNMA